MTEVDMILRRQGEMEAERGNFDSQWQDIADHLFPRQANFLTHDLAQGTRRDRRIFDEYAEQARERGVSIFEGYVMPRGSRYQMIVPADEALMKSQRNRAWFEQKTDQLFALRNNPRSGFTNETHESVGSLLSFGEQAMWPELRRDRQGRPLGLFYRSEFIGSIWFLENAWGEVDTVHRKFRLTARQAHQKWGDRAPESVMKAMRDNRPDTQLMFLHVIEPNPDADASRIDAAAMPIASCYIDIAAKQKFDTGGYRSMPLIVSRYEKAPFETYGRGPGMTVLPAVKASQQAMRDWVTVNEFNARPALGAVDDMLDQTIEYSPGGTSYGAIDARGNRLVQPLFDGGDPAAAQALLNQCHMVIDRAFFADLMLVNQPLKSHVNVPDILERTQEKGILLAPLARQESEWLTRMADREIDLMAEMGLLDDMPPEVREAGGAYQIRYENPLSRAIKAEQASGFYSMLQGVTPLVQAKPELIDAVLRKFPFEKVVAGLAYIHAVPAAWEATDEELAQAQEADANAANARQLLEAAPVVSDVVKNLSQAGDGNVLAA